MVNADMRSWYDIYKYYNSDGMADKMRVSIRVV